MFGCQLSGRSLELCSCVQVLTNHYERCGRYYGSGGWGSHGTATEEERRLTMMLFSGIFDSLAQRVSFFNSFHRRIR